MIDKEELEKIMLSNPFSAYVGMELVEVGEGYAMGRVKFDKKHENTYGGMHGGCAYALADTIGGIAALTYGRYVTTVNSAMSYLQPVKDTEYVYCEAKVVRYGGQLSVFSVSVMNDNMELLIDGDFTYYALNEMSE